MFALAFFVAVLLGPPLVPSTPPLEPVIPDFVGAQANGDAFTVVYSSPSGIATVQVDGNGVPSPEHGTIVSPGAAYVTNLIGDVVAYGDAHGAGVMRLGEPRRQIVARPYLLPQLAWNGDEYLFAWNDGNGVITCQRLDSSLNPVGAPFSASTFALYTFSLASSGDGFLLAYTEYEQFKVVSVSAAGVAGIPRVIGSGDNVVQRQNLVPTEKGYLLAYGNRIVTLDRDGAPHGFTDLYGSPETFLALAPGAYAIGNRGTLVKLDADANVTSVTKVPASQRELLFPSQNNLLVVSNEGVSIVNQLTMLATPVRAMATAPIPQSEPQIATADDGTILAAWVESFFHPRLGRLRGDMPIDGDGIPIEGAAPHVAIGTNGRDFLVAIGGNELSIAYLGTTGPLSAPRVIDDAYDLPTSIIWNGRHYVVFFTRSTSDANTGTCATWRERIYAATISEDLRSATIQAIDLGEGSQVNGKAVKTRDGIALAYSPAHAIQEAGGFTLRCRDTTDLAIATLDDHFTVRSNIGLSARGPRDDEAPIDLVTDGAQTVLTWSLVLDPHNNGARTVHNTLLMPIAGAVWTGSRIALIDPSLVPSDTVVTSRSALAYIGSSLGLGIGDSQVMIVRRVIDEQPGRVRPSR